MSKVTQIIEAAEKQLEELLAKSAPLRAERDELREKVQPLEDKIRELNTRIRAIEQPHVSELKRIIDKLRYPNALRGSERS